MRSTSFSPRPLCTLIVPIILIGFLLTTPAVHSAVTVTYDWTYNGNVLPQAAGSLKWTGSGPGTDTKFSPNVGVDPRSTSVNGSYCTIVSTGTGGNGVDSAQTFLDHPLGSTWTGWDAGNRSIIEITAKVNSQVTTADYAQGFSLVNKNVVGRQQGYFFYLGDDFIGFSVAPNQGTVGTEMTKFLMDTTDAFHTYQLVLDDDQAVVYVDGAVGASLVEDSRTAAGYFRLEFGDASTSNGGGSVSYQKIRYVSNVPEPMIGTAALLGLGVLALWHSRRCTNGRHASWN